MIGIYTTSKGLEKLCHCQDNYGWIEIIRKLGEIYIDNKLDIPLDEEDPLFILDAASKINLTKSDFISSLKDDQANVLKEPCGIYILDINEKEANRIQREYGVICMSQDAIDHNILTRVGSNLEIFENEKRDGWSEVFKNSHIYPINSLIIIDRYMFASDEYDLKNQSYDNKNRTGLDNLHSILNEILPKEFVGTFNIGLFIKRHDEYKKPHGLDNTKISSTINKLKKKLKVSYNILFEIFFISENSKLYINTHNRRIIANSFMLTADHKLTAFKGANLNIGNVDQNIRISPLFESAHQFLDNDTKYKTIRKDLENLKSYIKFQCDATESTDIFFQNGRKCDSFKEVKHRFLF